mgnify:CR=1 FL=1
MIRLISKTMAVLAAVLIFVPQVQAKEVRIGYVTTLTTGGSLLGKQMKLAVEIALDHMGNKMGPLDAKVIFEDDGFKPKLVNKKLKNLSKKIKYTF